MDDSIGGIPDREEKSSLSKRNYEIGTYEGKRALLIHPVRTGAYNVTRTTRGTAYCLTY